MSLSISFSMKFLVLLRIIDFDQWHVNLRYANLLFMIGMQRIMNKMVNLTMQTSAWCPARFSLRIASATSPFTYALINVPINHTRSIHSPYERCANFMNLCYGSYSTKARRKSFRDYKTSRLQDMVFWRFLSKGFVKKIVWTAKSQKKVWSAKENGELQSHGMVHSQQRLPSPLSPPSAKLMIMALEEYEYQSRRGIRVPKK
uniref:Uncharacterized protein n=1 Tax=Tanacetum cinerariifolium TaxID=118510 RepID=A0A6L2LXY1_TANCI|nr:hypothetical protein [Tanacetum cinerariifolium]